MGEESKAKASAAAPANPEENWRFSPLTYYATWLVAEPLFRLWARIRTTGKEHIPPGGGMIATSNHQSMLDPFIVAYAFRRPMRYMGKAELFKHPLAAWFFHLYGGFPVDRSRRDPQALRTSLNILKAGQVLGMFPEGTRTTAGELHEFNTGAIRLAIKTQVPIVPAGIWGAHRVLPRGAAFPRPGKIGLAVGPPIHYAHLYDHHPSPAEIGQAADELAAQIAALIAQAGRLWEK